jgi:hypothetical protein
MTINSRQNPADRSTFRLSLLMRMLIAEGPGTVIWKRYAGECVYDRSSHDLLRRELTSYSFMACPNAHFVTEQKDEIIKLSKMLTQTSEENSSCNSKLAKYFAKLNVPSVQHIRNLKELAEVSAVASKTYRDQILADYFVSQSGPIVICGSPEGFWGYRRLSERPRNQADDKSELETLLDDCGYSDEFDIDISVGRSRQCTVKQKRGAVTMEYSIADGFDDLGLIYVGRTSRKQLVVVLAGATQPYGTYSVVRLAMDAGRNEINSGLLGFLKGTSQSFSLVSNLRPWIASEGATSHEQIWEREAYVFRSSTPVDARIEHPKETVAFSVLEIAEWEKKLEDREPAKLKIRRESTRLAEYFATEGPISAMVKAYGQIQDDANAKDLLEWLLPDTHFIPALGNAPRSPEFRTYLREAFENGVPKDPIDIEFMQLMDNIDPSGANLIRSWVDIVNTVMPVSRGEDDVTIRMDSGSKPEAPDFRTYCLKYYRLDTNPLIILGSPESYLGFLDPTSCDPNHLKECDAPSQLAQLIDSINYPNRYQLHWEEHAGHILDRATRTIFTPISLKESAPDDYGIIYLCRDKSQRVVLVVAGLTSRGTEAGLQLMFEERRPDIDYVVQRFFSGQQATVEIAYKCTKSTVRQRSLITVLSDNLQASFSSNLEGQTLVDRIATALTGLPDHGTRKKTHSTILADTYSTWSLDTTSSVPKLILTASQLFLNNDFKGDKLKHKIFLSLSSGRYFTKSKKLADDCRNNPLRVIVLAETGSGKEASCFFLHMLSRPGKEYISFNALAIPESMMDSELFGHCRGSFTSASEDRNSIFYDARDGSVHVDELSLESREMQGKMLRVMESSKYKRVGDNKEQTTNANIIFSTNFALNRLEFNQRMELNGQRNDIGPRFNVFLSLPPLRQRIPEIIPVLMSEFLRGAEDELNQSVWISLDALAILLTRPYIHNFRELRNMSQSLAREIINPTSVRNPIRKEAIVSAFNESEDTPTYTKFAPTAFSVMEDNSDVIQLELMIREFDLFGLKNLKTCKANENAISNLSSISPKLIDAKSTGNLFNGENGLTRLYNQGDPFLCLCFALMEVGKLVDSKPSDNALSEDDIKKSFDEGVSLAINSQTEDGQYSPSQSDLGKVIYGLIVLAYDKRRRQDIRGRRYGMSFAVFGSELIKQVVGRQYDSALETRRSKCTEDGAHSLLKSDEYKKGVDAQVILRKFALLFLTGYSPFNDENIGEQQ